METEADFQSRILYRCDKCDVPFAKIDGKLYARPNLNKKQSTLREIVKEVGKAQLTE